MPGSLPDEMGLRERRTSTPRSRNRPEAEGRPRVRLTISIDTEEDDWIPSRHEITTGNILELPRTAEIFDELGARVTYFTTYRVAEDPDAAAALREVAAGDGVEIGAHLHPWNTPPWCGIETDTTMLASYPVEAQEAKIRRLVDSLEANLGVRPASFRAGRFGIGSSTLPILGRTGFTIDSSVTPLLSWKDFGGPAFRDAPNEPYRIDEDGDPGTPSPHGRLSEVPISVGYTRLGPTAWRWLARFFALRPVQYLRVAGLVSRLGGPRRVVLSPEIHSHEEMLELSRAMIRAGVHHLHLYFHSNSLVPGLTPFTRTASDVRRLQRSIRAYVESLSDLADLSFATVREAGRLDTPGTGSADETFAGPRRNRTGIASALTFLPGLISP